MKIKSFSNNQTMDFDEKLDTERSEHLNSVLRSLLDADADISSSSIALFLELVKIPDDPLERELLDAFVKHSPSLNIRGVSEVGGISMERAAQLVELATINSSSDDEDDEKEDKILPQSSPSLLSLEQAKAARKMTMMKRRSSVARAFDSVIMSLELASLDPSTLRDSFRGKSREKIREVLLQERLDLLKVVVPHIEEAKTSQGQDVVPLSALGLELHELWRVYIPLAMIIDDLICEHDLTTPEKAFILGINAPPGSGKSTFVELLKFLLLEIFRFENKGMLPDSNERVIVTVSQDDFYLTKADREAQGIQSRMEMEGMDVYLCTETLGLLADRTRKTGQVVEIPRFSKAHDDREPIGTLISDPVNAVLFEGWRVSIDHPLYESLIDIPDFLLCIDVDIDEVKGWKEQQSRRDAIAAGVPFDASRLEAAWCSKIVPVIMEYSDRVHKRADLVLSKGAGHVVTKIAGRISAFKHETHPRYHQ